MFKQTISTALVFGAVALAPPAAAQAVQPCQERAALIKTLESKYNESLDSAGLQGPEVMLEVWSAQDTGSFTVLLTKPNGISCVVATGQDWRKFETPEKKGITG